MAKLRKQWAERGQGRPGRRVSASSPIPGLSVAGGFKLMVEDRGGLGLADLAGPDRQADPARLTGKRKPRPGRRVRTQFRSNTPQLFMDIDRAKVAVPGRVARRRQPDAARSTSARSTSTASTSSAGTGR